MNKETIKPLEKELCVIYRTLYIGIAIFFCGIVIGAMTGWQNLTLISFLGFIITAVGIGIIKQDSK